MSYPQERSIPGGDITLEHQDSADNQEQAPAPLTEPLTHLQICWRIVIWNLSLAIIVVNVAVDIVTLILYYDSEEYAFFALTLIFLFLPTLVIAVASLVWLWRADKREDENARAEDGQFTVVSVVLHLALLGLVYRYGRLIMKASFVREKGLLVRSWERDAHILMLIQTILHCCCQVILQLYIIINDNENSTYILLSIICAAVNFMAILWSLFVYVLYDMFKGPHIKPISKIVIFISHACIIVSRILALAFFAVAFHAFVFIPFGVHWALWSISVVFISTYSDLTVKHSDSTVKPHKRLYKELPVGVVIGFILLFFYYNVKKGRTWCVVIPYQTLTFIETMVLSIAFYVEKPNEWYSIMILCLSILLFLLGSILMLIYYMMLHPKTKKYWTDYIQNLHTRRPNTTSTTHISTERHDSNES